VPVGVIGILYTLSVGGTCLTSYIEMGSFPKKTVGELLGPDGMPAEVNLVHNQGWMRNLFLPDEADAVRPSDLRQLLTSPRALQLRGLALRTPRGKAAAVSRAIAASPNLANLETLTLRYSGLGSEDIARIVASPHLAHLRALYLGGMKLGGAHWDLVEQHDYRSQLTNPIGPNGVLEIGNSPALAGLERLDISFTSEGNGQHRKFLDGLTGSPYLRHLKYLNIDDDHVTADELVRFAQSPTARTLEELRGTYNIALSPQDLEALMTSGLRSDIQMNLDYSETSGEPWPADLVRRFHARFPNVTLPRRAIAALAM
jgi:hypothetical protein